MLAVLFTVLNPYLGMWRRRHRRRKVSAGISLRFPLTASHTVCTICHSDSIVLAPARLNGANRFALVGPVGFSSPPPQTPERANMARLQRPVFECSPLFGTHMRLLPGSGVYTWRSPFRKGHDLQRLSKTIPSFDRRREMSDFGGKNPGFESRLNHSFFQGNFVLKNGTGEDQYQISNCGTSETWRT